MAIAEKDIKKLWGLSGGRCAFPGCNCDCLPLLDGDGPTVIGEMAHVIANSPVGPRGDGGGGDDRYANLILLCPTHHTLVDKAPEGKYPQEAMLGWKKRHEEAIAQAIKPPAFASRRELFDFIRYLLTENRACWSTYGPESAAATSNPFGNAYGLWEFRKLSIIVKNNSRLAEAIKAHPNFFEFAEYETAMKFVEHAAGFERNCYEATENTLRFPNDFEAMVNGKR